MSALVLALLLAAPCADPRVDALPTAQQPAACALLERPRADGLDPATLPPLYERPGFERARLRNTGAWKALVAQVQRWFEQLAQTTGAQTYSNVTRVLVLVLALALAGGVVLRFLARRRQPGAPPAAPSPAARSLELEAPATHLARAQQLLAAQPREAIREASLALLSSLERQRLARPDRVKTNRELVDELPGRGAPPDLVARVAPLLAWFDRAFYSLEQVPDADARRFLDDVQAVTRGTP